MVLQQSPAASTQGTPPHSSNNLQPPTTYHPTLLLPTAFPQTGSPRGPRWAPATRCPPGRIWAPCPAPARPGWPAAGRHAPAGAARPAGRPAGHSAWQPSPPRYHGAQPLSALDGTAPVHAPHRLSHTGQPPFLIFSSLFAPARSCACRLSSADLGCAHSCYASTARYHQPKLCRRAMLIH